MELSLTEKFLLLAQHPQKGRYLISGIYLNYGLTGALLLDTVLEQKTGVEDGKLILKKKRRSNDPLINDFLTVAGSFGKPVPVRKVLNKFSRRARKIKQVLVARMAKKRLIRIEDRYFLGFIRFKRHYLTGRKQREEVILQLKNNLLNRSALSNDDAAILGIIDACRMYKLLSSNKEELKTVKKKLKENLHDNAIDSAILDTVKQVRAAIWRAVAASRAASVGAR